MAIDIAEYHEELFQEIHSLADAEGRFAAGRLLRRALGSPSSTPARLRLRTEFTTSPLGAFGLTAMVETLCTPTLY